MPNVQKSRISFWLRMGREKVAQRLGYIWNSPCRQVFSPGCHFHLSSQDCPHLPPACHRFPRSLEQLPRGDDLKPGRTGLRIIICVPGNSDRFTLSQSESSQHLFLFALLLHPAFVAPCEECFGARIKKTLLQKPWRNQSLGWLKEQSHLQTSLWRVCKVHTWCRAWIMLPGVLCCLWNCSYGIYLRTYFPDGRQWNQWSYSSSKGLIFGLFPSGRCSGSFLLSPSPCWDSETSENSSKILQDLYNSTLLVKNLCTWNWKLSPPSW